jgi:glyoxalase family protein
MRWAASLDDSYYDFVSEECMPQPIVGLHHVTAIASDPQRNLDFYCEVLGLRLVKRTVNFDDPGSYHFYFGDDIGPPGSILTFFAWPQASRGRIGTGETSAVAFSVPASSLPFWEQRILAAGSPVEHAGERFGNPVLSFGDPDGMRIELVGSDNPLPVVTPRTSDIPAEHAIRGFDGVTLCEAGFELTAKVLKKMGFARAGQEGNRIRFVSPATALGNRIDILVQAQRVYGHMGAGTVHHIAFRAPLRGSHRIHRSSGDPDPHVPWSRVEASARELEQMGAQVELMRYTGRPHTIVEKELEVCSFLDLLSALNSASLVIQEGEVLLPLLRNVGRKPWHYL